MKDQILKWLEENRPQDKGARARVIRVWQKEEDKKRINLKFVRISPLIVRRRRRI